MNEFSIVSATAVDINKDGKWQVSYQLGHTTGDLDTHLAYPRMLHPSMCSLRRVRVYEAQSIDTEQSFLGSFTLLINLMVVVSEEKALSRNRSIAGCILANPDSRETVTVFLTHGRARLILEQLMPNGEDSCSRCPCIWSGSQTKNGSTLRAMSCFSNDAGPAWADTFYGDSSLIITGSGEQYDSLDLMKKTYAQRKIKAPANLES